MRRIVSSKSSVAAFSAAIIVSLAGCSFDEGAIPTQASQSPATKDADVRTVSPGATSAPGWEPVFDAEDAVLMPSGAEDTDTLGESDEPSPDGEPDGESDPQLNKPSPGEEEPDKNDEADKEKVARNTPTQKSTPKKAPAKLDVSAQQSKAISWLRSYRSKNDVPVWKEDTCLRKAAQSWAKKMAAANKASNPGPPSCAGYVTTLVAAGTVSDVSELLNAWTGSSSHRKTLQRMDLRVMGVGLHTANDPQRRGERLFAAVMLGQGAAPAFGAEYDSNSSFRPVAGRGRVARGLPLIDIVSMQLNREASIIEWNVVRGRTPDRSTWQSDREVAAGLWSSTDPVQGHVQVPLRTSVTRGSLSTKNLQPGEYTLQIRYGGKKRANHYSIIVW